MIGRNNKSVFALVLAAGCSTRFGGTKQTKEIDGSSLASRAINVANEVCGARSVLVVGHDWQAVKDSCEPLPGFLLYNDQYASGIGTSIARGLQSIRHAAKAVIVMLADQPLVTAAHVATLIETWSGADNEIVASAFADSAGPPVLFPSACFDELAALTGDSGGKHLLKDERFILKTVRFEAAAVDIDTPDDLLKL